MNGLTRRYYYYYSNRANLLINIVSNVSNTMAFRLKELIEFFYVQNRINNFFFLRNSILDGIETWFLVFSCSRLHV